MVTELFKVLSDPKGLGGWLRSWLPPALIANGVFFGYVWGALPSELRREISAPFRDLGFTLGTAWVTCAILLAIILQISNRVLYRILEGYALWPKKLRKKRIQTHTTQLKRLLAEREATRQGQEENSDSIDSRERLYFVLPSLDKYPLEPEWILPTKLGNIVRSFETYAYSVFSLDTQTFWHELMAVVPESARTAVGQSRSSADFLVSTYYCALLLALAASIPAIAFADLMSAVVALISVLVMIGSYHMLLIAVEGWRYGIQALVHLGRAPLARALDLRLPENIADERRMWRSLTGGVQHRTREWWKQLDDFRHHDGNGNHDSQDQAE